MRIVNISYRLPVSFINKNDQVELKPSNGGLANAIRCLGSPSDELHWAGVADFSRVDYLKGAPQYDGEFTLHPIFMDKELNHDYYNGFSNAVIWPLFHYFPSFVEYKPSHFEAYMEANRVIAEAINPLIKDGDVVWIHDYQLLPLSSMIREKHPEAKIGFFLHIPFPSYELIRLLPKNCRDTLVKSMLGADLIGFHTYDYAQHFLTSVQMIEGIQHKHFDLLYKNRRIHVGVYPISIDFGKFNDALLQEKVLEEKNKIKNLYEGKRIIFSVDRLDYTKGIVYRLKGFEKFLMTYPEWKEKIVFLLVAVPSRDAIIRYVERKQMVELLISEINGRHGNTKWSPIVYQYASVGFEELMALYTSCDIALISPLRDGMNLVAKEFVASRRDQEGVLLLSDMTGAAKELTDALLFNPLDEDEIADKIKLALEMPTGEQRSRMQVMQEHISRYDINKWCGEFMMDLKRCTSHSHPQPLYFKYRKEVLERFQHAGSRLILLDYDGTLADFTPIPDLAQPEERVLELLRDLAANPRNRVVIVSGRDQATLEKWFGALPIDLIAEHGIFTKIAGAWKLGISDPLFWRQGVLDIMETFAQNCSGAFVEEKSFSLCWHYRNTVQESGFAQSRELVSVLSDYLISTNANMIDGNKVVEVKPAQINKGLSILQNLFPTQYDFCLSIGDDKTDEDMFEVVNEIGGITIKVGKTGSQAKYSLETVQMVISFLEHLR